MKTTVIPTFTAEPYSDPFGFRIESKLYKSKELHGQVVVLMLTSLVDLKEKVSLFYDALKFTLTIIPRFFTVPF